MRFLEVPYCNYPKDFAIGILIYQISLSSQQSPQKRALMPLMITSLGILQKFRYFKLC
jgi:hypothetical protein